jgi:sulfur-oxidizing protein SoxB
VAEGAAGEPVWELVARHLPALKTVPPLEASRPRLIGVGANPGLA